MAGNNGLVIPESKRRWERRGRWLVLFTAAGEVVFQANLVTAIVTQGVGVVGIMLGGDGAIVVQGWSVADVLSAVESFNDEVVHG